MAFSRKDLKKFTPFRDVAVSALVTDLRDGSDVTLGSGVPSDVRRIARALNQAAVAAKDTIDTSLVFPLTVKGRFLCEATGERLLEGTTVALTCIADALNPATESVEKQPGEKERHVVEQVGNTWQVNDTMKPRRSEGRPGRCPVATFSFDPPGSAWATLAHETALTYAARLNELMKPRYYIEEFETGKWRIRDRCPNGKGVCNCTVAAFNAPCTAAMVQACLTALNGDLS